jgi:Protein of unknown function (DUF3383)
MAVTPPVIVDVSLQSSGVSRAGFATLIFIDAHRWFEERVRSYTSTTAAADDMPTDSKAYQAIQTAFAQSPRPSVIKIGRRECDITLTPATPAEDDVYTVTITVNDDDEVAISYTAASGDTAEDVVDALVAAVAGDAGVDAHINLTKSGSGSSAVAVIHAVGASDWFALSELSGFTYAATSVTETASTVLNAIIDVDNDFFCVTSSDHTSAFVEAMADEVSALEKVYFVSVQETGALTAYSGVTTDTLSILKQNQYLHTAGFFHHEADTEFPEVAYFAYNATYQPGKVIYQYNTLVGVSAAVHPTTGLPLTNTQLGYLKDRNASYTYTADANGIVKTRGGLVGNGEKIDVVISALYIAARLREGLSNLLFNQQGSKLGFDDGSINRVESTCVTISEPMLTTPTVPNMLDSIEFTFPRAADIDYATRQSGVLSGSFIGYLTGAITGLTVSGTLTYQL